MASDVEIWEQALGRLRHEVDEENFATWIESARFRGIEDHTLVLDVGSDFNRTRLMRKYRDRISTVVGDLLGADIELDVRVTPPGQDDRPAPVASAAPKGAISIPRVELNPRYTFENFVVGESNRFAHAACRAVAEPETEAWNPLLIWGGVGLGKTHLLQAIGHEFLARAPGARVRYVNSEKFVNDFIQGISQKRMAEFRDSYRQIDLLLLDDVQFIFGKEGTQAEFFHTFNELHSGRKKIVLSSDRPPSEMSNIEERLRSRFEWGLVVDVQAPDLETRVAILHQKAEMEGFELPGDVAIFVAERIQTNIRKLEGVLTSLRHHHRLTREPISMESVRQVLGHFVVTEQPRRVTVEGIQNIVCEYFDIGLGELVGKERHKKVALPRHLAMYLARLLTDLSYPEIATRFNGRHHTTVLHAWRKIGKEILVDPNLQNLTNYLAKQIEEQAD